MDNTAAWKKMFIPFLLQLPSFKMLRVANQVPGMAFAEPAYPSGSTPGWQVFI